MSKRGRPAANLLCIGDTDTSRPEQEPQVEQAWLSELAESDVAGCHEITTDKPGHPDYDHGFHLRHRRLVGPWMAYDGDGREVVAGDQSHRTCVSIEHCAARNVLATTEEKP